MSLKILIVLVCLICCEIIYGSSRADSTYNIDYIFTKLSEYLNEQGPIKSSFQFGSITFEQDGYYFVNAIGYENTMNDQNKTGYYHKYILRFKPSDIYDYDTSTYTAEEERYIRIKMLSKNRNVKWIDNYSVYNMNSIEPQESSIVESDNDFSVYFNIENKDLAIKFLKMFRNLLMYYKENRND